MSPRQSDARRRVVAAAAEMLGQHGLNATSIREMAKRAEAPLGSTYHHFPGGKQQVIAEAVTFAGAHVNAILDQHLKAGPVAGLIGFVAMWRESLVRSDFHIGCPVMAAAVEEPVDEIAEQAVEAASQVFSQWEAKLIASLKTKGIDRQVAAGIATLIVASIEGAIVLSRAKRNIAPFDNVAEQLQAVLKSAVSKTTKAKRARQ